MDINLLREMFYVIIAIVLILYICTIVVFEVNKRSSNKLMEYKINVETDINESIPELLETIVSECFNEYIVLNVEYKDIQYLDSEMESKIAKDVGRMVSERLSPALLSKMSLYYNIASISNIISEKIYILVLDYSIKKNQIRDSE